MNIGKSLELNRLQSDRQSKFVIHVTDYSSVSRLRKLLVIPLLAIHLLVIHLFIALAMVLTQHC